MAIKKEDLNKFIKATELGVTSVEDESSENNEVKLLHLTTDITVTGSLTAPDGSPMRVKDRKVYVGADNIEEFMQDCELKDNILYYKGPMHLDVSKPGGREVNGKFQITKPSKIWLVKVKFSRFGGSSRQKRQDNLNTMITNMFKGKEVLDLGSTDAATTTVATPEPAVVANQGADATAKSNKVTK